ncbi:MAG: DUF4149 domain-containing protein [Acidobacteria bacterium]|nr:DUF4149 domain-containing protein [Acidobacteriota bacterium]
MLALRYVYVLALVVWLGGMIVLGALVAPATFQILQATEPNGGRELAGVLFGAIIGRFHYVAYASGGLLLVCLAAMAVLGPRPRAFAVRCSIIGAMLAVSMYSGMVIISRIDAIQQEIGGTVTRLSATDARRVEFDGLHQLSTRLMMLNLAAAMILLYWEARE